MIIRINDDIKLEVTNFEICHKIWRFSRVFFNHLFMKEVVWKARNYCFNKSHNLLRKISILIPISTEFIFIEIKKK